MEISGRLVSSSTTSYLIPPFIRPFRSFNAEFWPNPAFMASEVKRLTGAEMMVSLWPSVEDASVNYLTLQQDGLLATTRDGPGVQDSFDGVYTRLSK